MIKCGLLGEKLRHSYSPQIHARLGDYEYGLFEKAESDVGAFLNSREWNGLNVTIPYKKTVIPFLSSLSDTAKKIGSVNTIVRKENGELYGDNTDAYGFYKTVERSGISVENKKTLVLGSGGASAAVVEALHKLNVVPVVISRSGSDNYENIGRHSDAGIIVNTTPLGMYPNTGVSAVDLTAFPRLSGVFDVIYNPARTELLLQAEKLGIPNKNGLYMLVAQAKRSAELFTGRDIPDDVIDRIYSELSASMQNIVLIGMPGVGKSTVAKKIGELTGRKAVDSDEEITARMGETPEKLINQRGESAFREIESGVLRDLGMRSGLVIATGGGVIVSEANYNYLHQNGTIVWLQRDISTLSDNKRPISQKYGAETLYRQREPLYRRFADHIVEISDDESVSAERVLDAVGRGFE